MCQAVDKVLGIEDRQQDLSLWKVDFHCLVSSLYIIILSSLPDIVSHTPSPLGPLIANVVHTTYPKKYFQSHFLM